MTEPSLSSHRNNFDFIRFAAAVLVWFAHSRSFYNQPDFISMEYPGVLGASIFFIVSGYFITRSYEQHPDLLVYLQHRALRIFPALFVVTLLSVFLLGPLMTTLSLSVYFTDKHTWQYLGWVFALPVCHDLPGVFTQLRIHSVNTPLWTLVWEMLCYLMVAWLGIATMLRVSSMIVVFVVVWAMQGILASHYVMLDEVTFHSFTNALDFIALFAGGSIMYIARRQIALKRKYLLFALFILAAVLYAGTGKLLFDMALIYTVIYLGFCQISGLKDFSCYGDFSYGMYIYAWPVQQMLLAIFHLHFMVFLAVSFTVTLVCAILSWHLIEKPMLRLKKH